MIGALLPLAIAVTISPIPIIAEIFLLFTKRPVANAAAYLAGFVVGVGVIVGVLVVVANAINLTKSVIAATCKQLDHPCRFVQPAMIRSIAW